MKPHHTMNAPDTSLLSANLIANPLPRMATMDHPGWIARARLSYHLPARNKVEQQLMNYIIFCERSVR